MSVRDELQRAFRRVSPSAGIYGLVLFGSSARGDSTDSSDLDFVVFAQDRESFHSARTLVLIQAKSVSNRPATVQWFSPKSFTREIARYPSFAAHLIDEGVVLHETPVLRDLRDQAASALEDKEALERELLLRVRNLRSFLDTKRFNGEYVPSLAHLYSIGRAVVIVKLLQRGVHEYSWRTIFRSYGNICPACREDLRHVEALRQYFEFAQGVSDSSPTTEPMKDGETILQVVSSISNLAAS